MSLRFAVKKRNCSRITLKGYHDSINVIDVQYKNRRIVCIVILES